MKKMMVVLAMLTMTLAANAQFEKGKKYVAASMNGLGMAYNGDKDFQFGVNLMGGYFIQDCWMINANLGYIVPGKDAKNAFTIAAGGRYYILQNGLYGGVNAKGVFSSGYNDFLPGIEIGYSFFVNDKMTIEPAIYYDQSIKKHSDYSTVGLKVGIGLYF